MKPLIAGLTVLVGVAGVLWIQARDTEPSEVTEYLSTHDEAVARVAQRVLDAVITYAPGTLEDQASSLAELATGGFLEDYEDLLESGLGEAVEATRASSDGRIASGPDVAFVSADRATAVARVVQEVKTASSERTIFSVMQIGLVLTGDTWKADRLEILSQNFL